ncbi:MAG: CDP-diacylglycerol--glycerol-3-phosphate 3-phosphatidyltransferase [Pseudomonadota bacterium]|jgi:CDP-diacylglycerol--glycerol-3-phosphate 3-phosphatidyltransferase
MTQNVAPWLRRLPNQLTLLRIACIPAVVALMNQGQVVTGLGDSIAWSTTDIAAGIIFAIAAITDFFDGWIARKYGVESILGKLLDPLADKLLVVSALIILVEKHRLAGWIAVVLIVRDLGINAIRLAAFEDNIMISSSWLGKTKTLFLDVGIVGLTVWSTWGFFSFSAWGMVAMWLALFVSLWSAGEYVWGYAEELKKRNTTPQ